MKETRARELGLFCGGCRGNCVCCPPAVGVPGLPYQKSLGMETLSKWFLNNPSMLSFYLFPVNGHRSLQGSLRVSSGHTW